MRYRIILAVAALSLGLGIAPPSPSAAPGGAAPAQEAWRTVCYYVYEPMWTPDHGWQLVYAKRCTNHLASAPGAASRAGAA